jgi:hypothetical protein
MIREVIVSDPATGWSLKYVTVSSARFNARAYKSGR